MMKRVEKLLATLSLFILSIAMSVSSYALNEIAIPETGGIGTTIFIVGGGAIMLVAVILLIVKKYKDR